MSKSVRMRGVPTRLFGAFLGAAIAGLLVIGMQLPLLKQPGTITSTVALGTPEGAPVLWPSVGSSALYIPSAGIAKSHHDTKPVPIASLTKMMTAYLAVTFMPIAEGTTGPCHVVSTEDVATYEQDLASNQSSVRVSPGEQLCELDLLKGMLIHSASNYADMLANMVATVPSSAYPKLATALGLATVESNFVRLMNWEAHALGLGHTRYVDVSGYDAGNVSTAMDQAHLAHYLMKQSLVRSIVDQTSVVLPVAGVVGSYTPEVGVDNVVGVKSGRTSSAGGCDVMAMAFKTNGGERLVYAVVLGARGGDLLTPAGQYALALSKSALAGRVEQVIKKGRVLAAFGWPNHRVSVVAGATVRIETWSELGAVRVQVRTRSISTSVKRGERVGSLIIEGAKHYIVPLIAERSEAAPTLWQRLR